jgi:hypothetical protein
MAERTVRPTVKMAANAKRGLRLRDKFKRGGTPVGVKRAQQLAGREELSPADVKSMYSYFARHAVDRDGKSHEWGSNDDPSAGFVAWLLWGGDEGRAWATRQREKLSGD